MIKKIPNDENFVTETEWLKSFHHFSFGQHRDQNKMNFGVLRVFNDDEIQPGKGFGFHPHNDMEIVTYVTEGTLQHKDNFGNTGVVEAGEIQKMSAGTGVFHSEYNHSNDQLLKLLQIWITPNQTGLKPAWAQHKFTIQDRLDKLLCVISPDGGNSMMINQNAKFFISRLENAKLSHDLPENRMAYLFVIDGKITLNDTVLETRDSAMITKEDSILIKPQKNSEIIFLELPQN